MNEKSNARGNAAIRNTAPEKTEILVVRKMGEKDLMHEMAEYVVSQYLCMTSVIKK